MGHFCLRPSPCMGAKMNSLQAWAARWGVPYQAILELQAVYAEDLPAVSPIPGDSEKAVMHRTRHAYTLAGGRLFRNNVGMAYNEAGTPLFFGLGNQSAGLTKLITSSDLIGIMPRLITADMVGRIIGQFTAIECKHAGWKSNPKNKRQLAQKKFQDLINTLGGHAAFTTGEPSP